MRPSHCLGAAQERGGRLRGNVGGAGPLLAGQPPPPPPPPPTKKKKKKHFF